MNFFTLLFFCFCEKFLYCWNHHQQLPLLMQRQMMTLFPSSFLLWCHLVNSFAFLLHLGMPCWGRHQIRRQVGLSSLSLSRFLPVVPVLGLSPLDTPKLVARSHGHRCCSIPWTWNQATLVSPLDLAWALKLAVPFPYLSLPLHLGTLAWHCVSFAWALFHQTSRRAEFHKALHRTWAQLPTHLEMERSWLHLKMPLVAYMQPFQHLLCQLRKWYTLHWCQSQ